MADEARRESRDREDEQLASRVGASPPSAAELPFGGGNQAVVMALMSAGGQASVARSVTAGGGVSNQAVAGMLMRQEHSGPSYAHHGPPGGVIDDRRTALTPQKRLGEAEIALAGELAQSVGWIGEAVSKIYMLVEDAKKAEKEGKPFFGEDTFEMTQKLVEIADALNKLQIGVRATHAKVKDANAAFEKFEQMNKATETLGLLVNALATLRSGAKTSEKLKAFQAKPDAKTAEEWADSVVGTFDDFGKVVGNLPMPPGLDWITDYFQGLLGAPKAYVGFFKSTMKARYGEIDRTVGRLEGYTQFIKEGETIVWAGPACGMVGEAWFFDQFLQNWIRQQQKNKGIGATDLYVYAQRELATILLDKLGSDKSVTEENRLKWGAWLTSKSK